MREMHGCVSRPISYPPIIGIHHPFLCTHTYRGDFETAGKFKETISPRIFRVGLGFGQTTCPNQSHTAREQPTMAVSHAGCPSNLMCEPSGGKRSGGSDPASPIAVVSPARPRPVDRVHGPRHHPIPAFPGACGGEGSRQVEKRRPHLDQPSAIIRTTATPRFRSAPVSSASRSRSRRA